MSDADLGGKLMICGRAVFAFDSGRMPAVRELDNRSRPRPATKTSHRHRIARRPVHHLGAAALAASRDNCSPKRMPFRRSLKGSRMSMRCRLMPREQTARDGIHACAGRRSSTHTSPDSSWSTVRADRCDLAQRSPRRIPETAWRFDARFVDSPDVRRPGGVDMDPRAGSADSNAILFEHRVKPAS